MKDGICHCALDTFPGWRTKCGCPDPDCYVRLYRDNPVHLHGQHWRVECAFLSLVETTATKD